MQILFQFLQYKHMRRNNERHKKEEAEVEEKEEEIPNFMIMD